ncbi:enoyl-CoA hydratase/isomerase family protein [Candidatus Poribacteria bacterium]|nr:enoyl-CoA hydratase/isomerase family protein [Candidatus Poribacteria bacterium]
MRELGLETIRVAVTEKGVARVALNRPPVNAINRKMLDELAMLFAEMSAEPAVRAVVVYGEGRSFAAGADIKEIASLPEGEAVMQFSQAGTVAFDRMADFRRPVIAAIRGFCLGGGNELAMACHMRFADPGAQFGQPEIKLGICPGFAGTQRLPRLAGKSQALRLLLTGETIGAVEAHQLGLVDLITAAGEDVVERAMRAAETMAGHSMPVIEAVMELVTDGMKQPQRESWDYEPVKFGELSRTADMKEGFAAFLEKRKPVFRDQ